MSRRSRLVLPLVVVLLHTGAVLAIALLLYVGRATLANPTEDSRMVWYIFIAIDFPSSLLALLLLLPFWASNDLNMGTVIVVPTLVFTIVGGVQYFMFARLYLWYKEWRKFGPGGQSQ